MSVETGSQSVGEALEAGTKLLRLHRRRSPRLDAEVLLSHVLRCSRTSLYARGPEPLDEDLLEAYLALLQRRRDGEPVAHLVGWKEFYGRRFSVSPQALIPRPETELLVDTALERAPRGARVLDLCTGTGAVAITVAMERPDAEVVATDLSREALEVAAENVRRHGARVKLLQGDLFAAVEPGSRFHLIVANPPYVGTERGPAPEDVVIRHEPALALFGGPDGLDVVRRIAMEAPDWLEDGGSLALEVAPWQTEIVEALLVEQGFRSTRLVPDLQGLPRVVVGAWEDR